MTTLEFGTAEISGVCPHSDAIPARLPVTLIHEADPDAVPDPDPVPVPDPVPDPDAAAAFTATVVLATADVPPAPVQVSV